MLNFILDIDGVLSNGKSFYTSEGRLMKEFGPDDADALKLLSKHVRVILLSQDKEGYDINRKRVEEMGFDILEIASRNRKEFIESTLGFKDTIYMGDSFLDLETIKACKWSLCTSNASFLLKDKVDYVTDAKGGNRAVAEAVFWISRFILNMKLDEFLGIRDSRVV